MLRDQKKRDGQKPSIVKKTAIEDRCEQFVQKVLSRRQPVAFCTHFLVGSSLLWDTLRTGYTLQKAHQYIRTSINARLVGASGEQAFRHTNQEIRWDHPFAISRIAPWVCCSPDFIVGSFSDSKVVEVKTFTEAHKALAFYHTVPHRTVVQVWASMELMKLQKGQIRVYWTDQISRTVTLIGTIEVNRTTSLFDRSIYCLSVLRWCDFLVDFFATHHLTPLRDWLDMLSVRLSKRFSESKEGSKCSAEEAKRMQFLDPRPISQECMHFLGSREEEDLSGKKVPLHKEYFAGHKFVSQSKRTRTVFFDMELRQSLTQELLSVLSEEDRKRLDSLLKEQYVVPTTGQLQSKMTKAILRRVDEQHPPSKEDLLLKQLTAQKKRLASKQARIKELEEQVITLQAENNALRLALTQRKAPSKRKLLKAYRLRKEERQSRKANQNAPLDLSETRSTGRGHPRRK